MTANERDEEVAQKLLEYSNHEKTVACLRERLHMAWKALQMLNLDGGKHPTPAELDKARQIAGSANGVLQENLHLYTEALHERDRLKKYLRRVGHEAVLGD